MSKKKEEDFSVKPISREESEAVVLDENFSNLDKLIASKNVFNHSKNGLRAVRSAMQMLSTTTGMYARIPIYCKDEKCPFADNCILYMHGCAPKGEACPLEVAKIDQKLRAYSAQFKLDEGEPEEHATDWALVEEIICMEIYMDRCKSRMALEQDPVQQMIIGQSDDGTPILSPNVSRYVDAYEKFSRKRDRDYELLLATRKSNQKDKPVAKASDIFELIEKAQSMPGFYDIESNTVQEVKQ